MIINSELHLFKNPDIYYETLRDKNGTIAAIYSHRDSDGKKKYCCLNNIEQTYVKGYDTVSAAKEQFFKYYEVYEASLS